VFVKRAGDAEKCVREPLTGVLGEFNIISFCCCDAVAMCCHVAVLPCWLLPKKKAGRGGVPIEVRGGVGRRRKKKQNGFNTTLFPGGPPPQY
jgi:hypothetical protein